MDNLLYPMPRLLETGSTILLVVSPLDFASIVSAQWTKVLSSFFLFLNLSALGLRVWCIYMALISEQFAYATGKLDLIPVWSFVL